MSENGFYILAKDSAAPRIILRNEKAVVVSSDITSGGPKPPPSDVTDLGNRGFYHHQESASRTSVDSLDFDRNYEHLELWDRFAEERVETNAGERFIPRALLSSIVDEECVINQLSMTKCLGKTHTESEILEYAETICKESPVPDPEDESKPAEIKSFKKIFTILVMIEETSSIVRFIKEDVNDTHLPLVNHPWGKNGMLHDLRRKGDGAKKLKCFDDWRTSQKEAFYKWQWVTIAPFFHKGFDKDVKHFPLHDFVILPFTSDKTNGVGSNLPTVFKGM